MWDLYNAPHSSTHLSIYILPIPRLFPGHGVHGPKFPFVNANCGSLFKPLSHGCYRNVKLPALTFQVVGSWGTGWCGFEKFHLQLGMEEG